MRKSVFVLLAAALIAAGCKSNSSSSASISSSTDSPIADVDEEVYNAYADGLSHSPSLDSWTVSAICRYDLIVSDDSRITYAIDGILEQDADGSTAHVSQHINSNGMTAELNGYYLDGRLYNSYNGITYYEDMTMSDLKSSMLVPLDPYTYRKEQIRSIAQSIDENGFVTYTIVLNEDAAEEMFTARYDQYDLKEQDGFKLTDAEVVNVFDPDGCFVKEKADFEAEVDISGTSVKVEYTSEVSYMMLNRTSVSISDEKKAELESYVAFNEINTDEIEVQETPDDEPGATVTDTFRKRLISRLGYEVTDTGSYRTDFNENEGYVINFDNCTFEYHNYSITYSYSWKNEVGSMGGCTYVFNDKNSSSGCDSTTIDRIQEVKSYLEMELYYCGLSLEDLIQEAK